MQADSTSVSHRTKQILERLIVPPAWGKSTWSRHKINANLVTAGHLSRLVIPNLAVFDIPLGDDRGPRSVPGLARIYSVRDVTRCYEATPLLPQLPSIFH